MVADVFMLAEPSCCQISGEEPKVALESGSLSGSDVRKDGGFNFLDRLQRALEQTRRINLSPSSTGR